MDRILSAGETAPDCGLGCIEETLDCVLAVEGLTLGGRIECFLVGTPAAGRGKPAIDCERSFAGIKYSLKSPLCALRRKICWGMSDIESTLFTQADVNKEFA